MSHTEALGSKVTLVLPYPPSVNILRAVFTPKGKGRARTIDTDVARAYRKAVHGLLRAANAQLRWTAPLLVEIDLFRPRRVGDASNPIKALEDGLQSEEEDLRNGTKVEHPGLFEDDEQTVEIRIRRYDDKHYPRAQVTVTVVDAPSGPPPERWPEPPGWAEAKATIEAAMEKMRERGRRKRKAKEAETQAAMTAAPAPETYGQRMLRAMPQATRPQRRRGAALYDLATSATYPPRKP